jgi:hypothetical protein
MGGTRKVSWFLANMGHWHRVLAWVRYGDNGPWSASTACHSLLREYELGKEGQLAPAEGVRCRRCDVAEILTEPPSKLSDPE